MMMPRTGSRQPAASGPSALVPQRSIGAWLACRLIDRLLTPYGAPTKASVTISIAASRPIRPGSRRDKFLFRNRPRQRPLSVSSGPHLMVGPSEHERLAPLAPPTCHSIIGAWVSATEPCGAIGWFTTRAQGQRGLTEAPALAACDAGNGPARRCVSRSDASIGIR